MFLCIISPQNAPKLVIKVTKIRTREQNFQQMVSWGGGVLCLPDPTGFGPGEHEDSYETLKTHKKL